MVNSNLSLTRRVLWLSMVVPMVFTAWISALALAEMANENKLHVVQEGNTLKLEYTPAMGNAGGNPQGPPIPSVSGVPQTGMNLSWSCRPANSPPPPNVVCHSAYEDRLGCLNGGAGKMCDTVVSGGSSDCVCIDLN